MSMSDQPHRPMSWQDQLVDLLGARYRTWLVAAVVLILLGALLALLAPATLPPTPFVGLAVGAAAVLLATAVVIGLDVSDVIVRGRRHVEAAGGHVAGTISRETSDIEALIDLIDAHDREGKVRVALTPASRSAGVPGSRANIVAAELAGRGAKVLVTDLTRGGTPAVGLSDVIVGDRTLGEAVRFDDELYLAHLAVGSEPELALEGFSSWARGLPPDLDVLVAALPPLSEPGVLPSVEGVELVLLLVEVGRTERVDLIASLDAIDAAGVPAELVLVDDSLASTAAPGSGSVEVLSTPGSTPRQRDPDGFDLHESVMVQPPLDDEVATEESGHEVESELDPVEAADVGPPSEAVPDTAAEPVVTEEEPPVDPAATMAMPPVTADPARESSGPADDLDEFEEPDGPVTPPGGGHVRTIRRRQQPVEQDTVAMPPVVVDTSMPTERLDAAEIREVEPTPADPDDEPPPVESTAQSPTEPASRSSSDRDPVAPSSESTPAMAGSTRDEPEPSTPTSTEVDDEPSTSATAADDPSTPADVDDEPSTSTAAAFRRVSTPTAAAADEPAPQASPDADADPGVAPVGSTEDAAAPSADDERVPADTDPDADTGDEGAGEAEPEAITEDDDPIDVVAREQARLSASLQQLAQDVWQRGDGE